MVFNSTHTTRLLYSRYYNLDYHSKRTAWIWFLFNRNFLFIKRHMNIKCSFGFSVSTNKLTESRKIPRILDAHDTYTIYVNDSSDLIE